MYWPAGWHNENRINLRLIEKHTTTASANGEFTSANYIILYSFIMKELLI